VSSEENPYEAPESEDAGGTGARSDRRSGAGGDPWSAGAGCGTVFLVALSPALWAPGLLISGMDSANEADRWNYEVAAVAETAAWAALASMLLSLVSGGLFAASRHRFMGIAITLKLQAVLAFLPLPLEISPAADAEPAVVNGFFVACIASNGVLVVIALWLALRHQRDATRADSRS